MSPGSSLAWGPNSSASNYKLLTLGKCLHLLAPSQHGRRRPRGKCGSYTPDTGAPEPGWGERHRQGMLRAERGWWGAR